ncbi:hypothetical protein BGZ58_009793 [Dissophora ornata]|nr:hypothetical protein BGZ58_009793 [Dissophora ornata]
MEIILADVSSNLDPGFAEYYMELREMRLQGHDAGDGTHMSTLADMYMDKRLQLDLWQLPASDKCDQRQPNLVAQIQVPLLESFESIFEYEEEIMMVSVSWDASIVALVAVSTEYLTRALSIYNYCGEQEPLSEMAIASPKADALSLMLDGQLAPGLKDFCGYGRFHITSTKNQNIQDELLITCNFSTVNLYCVYGTWSHLRTIVPIGETPIKAPRQLIQGLRAKYFAAVDSTGTISICDLETGLLVTRMVFAEVSTVGFSSDGSLMVIRQSRGVIKTLWTESATVISSRDGLAGVDGIGSNLDFIQDDSKIILPLVILPSVTPSVYSPSGVPDEANGIGYVGLILAAASLVIEGRVSITMPCDEERLHRADTHNTRLYTAHGSKLDLVRLNDTIMPGDYDIEHWVGYFRIDIAECAHHQLYASTFHEFEDPNPVTYKLDPKKAFCSYPSHSLKGILALIEIFRAGDKNFQQATLQYVGQHINFYPDPHNLLESILAKICQGVTQENRIHYGEFMETLLGSSHGRWVPRPDLDEKTNPISVLLDQTKKVPRIINLVQTLINYCIRMAKDEKDVHFVLPIPISLRELITQQTLHTDAVHSTLRNLVFIPIIDRSFVIDSHLIAYPPKLRWRFWEKNARPLYECKDPVLQLDRNPKIKPHDPRNDNFTRDLFVASFDMLWCAPKTRFDVPSSTMNARSKALTWQSWVRALIHIILMKCKFKLVTTVISHDFALESLDNPAIAALIEYKWNTIGYTYWLVRFVPQCIYYLLVLLAVLLQVYSDKQSSLTGVLVTIIIMSMLFELRISKIVCQFVTTIIRTIGKIRVYFVFPKEIYYSATLQQKSEYEFKYSERSGESTSRGVAASHKLFGHTSYVEAAATMNSSVDHITIEKRHLDNMRQWQEMQYLEQKQSMEELKNQFSVRQNALEEQLRDIKGLLSTALAERS